MDHDEAVRQFYDILWPHRQAVLRVATLLSRNATEADDLAQETMLKAFRALDTFRAGSDPKAWLLQILRNTRIDRLRKVAGRGAQVSLDDAEAFLPAAPEQGGEGGGLSEQELLERFSDQEVIDALKTLPEEIRMTLLLVDVEQLDHKEAAELLDVPVGTVKSRTFRGRGMLRERLTRALHKT